MTRLCIATQNIGKQAEFRELLADWRGEIVFPQELGLDLDVEEVGDSFAEIAAVKARAYARASGLSCLADDSGLEVDALDGAPGIYTARYAGPDASDADRYRKLLAALEGVPEEGRTARFRCAVAIARPAAPLQSTHVVQPTGAVRAPQVLQATVSAGRSPSDDAPESGICVDVAEGTCEGVIAFAPRGAHGFGYDPVFILPEYARTMAELPAEVKNRISHRARALQAARGLLDALLA